MNEINSLVGSVEQWTRLVRDIGLIIGLPVLITVGIKLYKQQVQVLRERIGLLQETQYDRALSMIKSQRELYEIERGYLENRINELQSTGGQDEEIDQARENLVEVSKEVEALHVSTVIVERASSRVNFVQCNVAPIFGEMSQHLVPVRYEESMTVSDFLDRIWVTFAGRVESYSYGFSWQLKYTDSGQVLVHQQHQQRVKADTTERSRLRDSRTLREVGVQPGTLLVAELLSGRNGGL